MISSRCTTAHAARTGPQLSDRGQRSFPGHESPESSVSQLSDLLCRPGCLLHPPSQPVAGKNPCTRHSPPGRATLSAAGHAAALAPASALRTSARESQTHHHCQVTADSLSGTDSFRIGGGTDSDSPSFSQQAPAVELQRTGVGNPRQRGISLRRRASAAAQETGDHSRLEQELQP